MAASLAQSLFSGRSRVEGSEIKFRAVCALGWAIRRNLPELRSIVDELPQSLNHLHWIDFIETRAIEEFASGAAGKWPDRVSNALLFLRDSPAVEPFAKLSDFFGHLANEMKQPQALDPAAQFAALNSRGFTLADQYINHPLWSTDLVRAAWSGSEEYPCLLTEDNNGNFRPVTAADKTRIELRVNTQGFQCQNALLFYLTMEYQMMHEYISHVLPVWNSGNALEEEFLLAIMFLYYQESGTGDGLVSLVAEADERRADVHRWIRKEIQHELAPALEARLSQLLLELAVLDEDAMPLADKRNFLALLKSARKQEGTMRRSIRNWIRQDDISTLHGRFKIALGHRPASHFVSIG